MALPDEQVTQRLVADVAVILEPGDFVTLSGDLGAGKTTFARALIRHLAGDPAVEVPSPTFTLMQTYELPRFPLVHADFYRLQSPSEAAELGFDDLPERAVVLLEWPERASVLLPADRLDVTLLLNPQKGAEFRNARVTGHGAFAARVDRMLAMRRFLNEAGYEEATRARLQGDASTRIYERLTLGDRRAILMNSPRRADGPPVKHGRPYSAIAHLAEDVTPFVAIANALRARGFSAPEIRAADLADGFVVLEDLGQEGVVSGDPPAPIEQRYAVAVEVLAALHVLALPEEIPVAPHVTYRLPRYDLEAFLIEAELLLDWYLPKLNAPMPEASRPQFENLWRAALQSAVTAPPTWVLRDYHSPNLLWLADRTGPARIGLLDFQDAVIGPCAYDLASLLQDARIDVPERMEIDLLGRYVRARRAADPNFDTIGFAQVYAALAAQRATKILGIFARLERRDGKPQYLRHIPRVWGYLQRSLAHPSLTAMSSWYKAHVPPPG